MKYSTLVVFGTLLFAVFSSASMAGQTIERPVVKSQQLNPGLDARVQVVPLVKKDPAHIYTITKLPLHGTLYYNGKKIETAGFRLDDPKRLYVDPDNGNITVVFLYTTTDMNTGEISEEDTIIMPFLDIQISGSVFHDSNGNSIVDGKKISEIEGEQLYISLVNKNEKILSSKPVSSDGTYMFNNNDGLQPRTNYALVLSTRQASLSSVLPEKWSPSGEIIASQMQKKEPTRDGIIVVNLHDKNIDSINFGVDIHPLAKKITAPVQLNPGGDARVTVPALKGSDEDNSDPVRFFLTSLPENATLYDNGKEVKKANVLISDPDTLSIDPIDGDQNVVFHYVTADNAGVISKITPVTMPFLGLNISGQVLQDGNGDKTVNGIPVSHIDQRPLYISLFNAKGKLLASVAVDENGSFAFNGENGIVPNSDYTLVLSVQQQSKTSILSEGWSHSSEGLMNKEGTDDGKIDGILKVNVNIKDITSLGFGLNSAPVADNIVVDAQLNPGGENEVAVPRLRGQDNESNNTLSYIITSLPKHAKLLYAHKTIESTGFVAKEPGKLTLNPDNGKQIIEFSYKVQDRDGVDSAPAAVTMTFNDLYISGHLINDGNRDGKVKGPVIADADGTTLYILLLGQDEHLLSSKAIAKDGSYTFEGLDGIKPQTEFFIALSKTPEKAGFGLPKGWNHTGENINSLGEGNDGSADGVISVKIKTAPINDIDLGINKKPKAAVIKVKKQLNPGELTHVPVPPLSGRDKESGTELIYKITSLPTQGTLFMNDRKIMHLGTLVKENNLSIDPEDGNVLVLFTYSVTDQAGVESNPERVEMAFAGLTISGHVFNDGNSDEIVKGAALGKVAGQALYITLLSERGAILSTTKVLPDGTYLFDGEHGVIPNSNYHLVLSKEKSVKVSSLPDNWVSSGENLNAGQLGKESQIDGMISVIVMNDHVTDVDFGIEEIPTAKSITVETQINPGGERRVSVPGLSGNDRESGTKLRYMIITVPKNATLYYESKAVKAFDFITQKGLELDPNNGTLTTAFTYVSIDETGAKSKPAMVKMHFSGLKIGGHVFEDFIPNGNVDGHPTSAPDGKQLYITLLDHERKLLDSKPVAKDGSYIFDGHSGVNARTAYTLVLTKEVNATTSSLPEGWHYADGENINTLDNEGKAEGNDGKKDGEIHVIVNKNDIYDVDFSINNYLQ